MPDLIFLSIAAYRDPQLIATIEDALAKAADPTLLRFGICWQRAVAPEPEDPIPNIYRRDPRFRILDVPYTQSKGACWARAEIMKLWQQEPWFLQVDSHCRFAPHWDQRLIRMAADTRSPKPILSTYATAFTPGPFGSLETLEDQPLQMAFQGFTAEGIPYMKPVAIPHWQNLLAPIPARFLSGGFLFAPGTLVQDVPYDPDLYFLGEEITMTLRAFTHGYDLFHPHQTLVWHDYRRADAFRHWDDHTAAAATAWGQLDLLSKQRVRTILDGQPLAHFGLGHARTLTDYERYAGVSFQQRRVQDYTVRAGPPPNPPAPADWAAEVYTWLVRITLPTAALTRQPLAETAFWYLGITDSHGAEIYRRDLTAAELQALPTAQPEAVLICELQAGSIPAAWKIWPHTTQGTWLPSLDGTLTEDDYTILLEQPEDEQPEDEHPA